MNARGVALAVARDVFALDRPQRRAQEALEYRLRSEKLDDRDRAFVTQVAYGSIKMRRTIEYFLDPYVGGRDKPLPPTIAEILRLATYELKFLRSKAHGVVSEYVQLAKQYGHRGTAALVNAVLRSLLRDDPQLPDAHLFEDRADYLGVRFSFPTWIVRSFMETFASESIETILAGLNESPQSAICVNTLRVPVDDVARRLTSEGWAPRRSAFVEETLLVDRDGPRREGEDAKGEWVTQSEAAAMPVDIANPQPGEAILDVCSGRGNKALQSAARLSGSGTLTCVERDARKAELLARRLEAAGATAAILTGDATQPILPGQFDRAIVDAPCSGLGILGRHPEARWRKTPADAARLAHVQTALLESIAPHVYPGGALVYAVCSTDARETVDRVEGFLRRHNFSRGLVPSRYEPFLTEDGDVLVPPGIDGRDGFFISRLERAT